MTTLSASSLEHSARFSAALRPFVGLRARQAQDMLWVGDGFRVGARDRASGGVLAMALRSKIERRAVEPTAFQSSAAGL
jgi:hypothetical protein